MMKLAIRNDLLIVLMGVLSGIGAWAWTLSTWTMLGVAAALLGDRTGLFELPVSSAFNAIAMVSMLTGVTAAGAVSLMLSREQARA